jgi:hypothetical protein
VTVHQINNVDDSRRIVYLYHLEGWGSDSGSPQGFSNWLFVKALSVSTEELAERIEEYLTEFEAHADQGIDFDELMQRDADTAMQGHRSAEKAANDLLWAIRGVKDDEFGRAVWFAIAEWATSANLADVVQQTDVHVAAHALTALRDLAKLERSIDAGHLRYFPTDVGHRDTYVRIAIERLDQTLEGYSVWQDAEVHWPVEVSALMTLATKLEAIEAALLIGSPCESSVH